MMEIYLDGFTVSDNKQGFSRPENFDSYAEGKGWTIYRGGNDWENGTTACAVYLHPSGEEIGRIWFTVKFPKGITSSSDCPEPIQKLANEWGEKAAKKWLSITRKIHSKPREYFPDGSPWYKEWKDCFIEVLKSRDMKKYIKEWGADHTTWRAMKEDKNPDTSIKPKNLPES